MTLRNLIGLVCVVGTLASQAEDIVLPPEASPAAQRGGNTQTVVHDIPLPGIDQFNSYDSASGIDGPSRIEVPISVPQFDGTLGTLTAINITMNGEFYTEIGVEANGILNTGIPHQAAFASLDTLFSGTAGYPAVGLLQSPTGSPSRIAPAFYPIGSLGVSCFGVPGDEDACSEFDFLDAGGGNTVDLFIFETPDGPIYTLSDWVGQGSVPNFTVFIDNPQNGGFEPQFQFTLDNVGGAFGEFYTEIFNAWINIEYVYEVDAPDTDDDGVIDSADNCLAIANADQRDTDGDGLGNLCDADLSQDCVVNVIDLGQLRTVFFTSDADADLNGDGTVNVQDLGLMRSQFFSAPGPSGIANLCGG